MCNDEKLQECLKPEGLKDSSQPCSPGQIRECHGESGSHLCVETTGCEHPERLRGRPGECSPEQFRQCHGDPAERCCAGDRADG
jgi:hypothetical protein